MDRSYGVAPRPGSAAVTLSKTGPPPVERPDAVGPLVGGRSPIQRPLRVAVASIVCLALLVACGRTVLRAEGSANELERWSIGIEF